MASGMPSGIASGTATAGEFKAFENRLRRAAWRQGYRLEKSRRRDVRAMTYGMYRLVDLLHGGVVGAGAITGGAGGYGLDIADVASELLGAAPGK